MIILIKNSSIFLPNKGQSSKGHQCAHSFRRSSSEMWTRRWFHLAGQW